ncbi:4a-hydroxytetrahydrobiopterin dehydratase [Streptomyces sp. NRRL S-920]|uniref:4a-hydroxytetrahydrobiopterin dehydratase n=1 Tax=Streptomyces sp. NRRL S-920 TaxID=1463921 RepID=UPI0004C957BA|nr:4a-hydroxytetrahydrobiopterin dehydratase [Streptomyces sp. NRRL S-920]
MTPEPLSHKEIEDRLAELPGWSLDGSLDGGKITRSYRLGSHFAAVGLVVHIAQTQDELDHHADIVLGYNTVALSVNTHSAGGAITALDLELARRVEEFAPGHGAH